MNYWLLKSEPSVFSIDDLAAAPKQTTFWEGVRNYQARNLLRDRFQAGDHAFFYHSNTKIPGIAGVVQVLGAGYPDPTAVDPGSPYFDAASDSANPRWYGVDVKLIRKLDRFISLTELKEPRDALADLILLRRGNRLSVMPITTEQWNCILGLE
ncbi:MAG: EVE domain-containing protein [Candidatus Competibacteraceae bacterium]|jgi:predicted RNA-binding protein with PUA-like domain|nr:EVE domain-containing protein [Candidatus Competibacteraceae bacterium]